MTFIEKLRVLDRIHHLIRRKGTGSPRMLAKRLNVSERTVYNIIADLRDLGAEVYFCPSRCSYCYREDVEFNFLPVVKMDYNVKGGKNLFLKSWYEWFSVGLKPYKEIGAVFS